MTAGMEIKSIEDMLNQTYGNIPSNAEIIEQINRAFMTTGITGAFNTIYGPYAFNQLNQETATFGILPKYAMGANKKGRGFRVNYARPSDYQGKTAESTSALATATDPSSMYLEVDVANKIQQIVYQTSELMALHEGVDDVGPTLEEYRQQHANWHVEGVEASLNTDFDTLAGNGFESIDRVCASQAERVAESYTANDEDLHGVVRGTYTWWDAQVGHNSGTDRGLTPALMRGVLYDCKKQGARTNAIQTGYDTYNALISQLQAQQRFQELVVDVGVQGVQPSKPGDNKVSVLAFDSIPVFSNAKTLTDTISRMYFLDTTNTDGPIPRLGFRMAKPPTNVESTDPIKNGAYVVKGLFVTMGELVCTRANVQGKLRDLA